MTHRFNLFMLALVLLVGLPVYVLLFDNPGTSSGPKPLTIAQLRVAAASLPGPAPAAVEVEVVASRRLPQALFAAGSGFQLRRSLIKAYRLQVPGNRPIMIDSGMTPAEAQRLGMTFRSDAQARVNRALAGAGMILLTHEHADHMGGLAAMAAADPAIVSRALLSPAQAELTSAAPWPAASQPIARLSAQGLQAVAPGVVVIPAPGHTPGSQMIYVRTAGGREYLFAGDTATISESWRRLRLRSRLLAAMTSPEDREEVHSWLRTIRRLRREAPGLMVVTGHDFEPLPPFAASASPR